MTLTPEVFIPLLHPRPALPQLVWHLQRGINPVMTQGRDQLAIAGVLGGLGNVRVGTGQVGLEDVFLAMRGRQDHDGDHPQERVALDLGEDLAAVESRQIEVEQDQVGLVIGGRFARRADQTGNRVRDVRRE